MNKTTVKRGIGAVLLALIAAGLLAFLLKDKADQRQDIVDMPLPGSDNSTQAIDGTTKLPQLSMDNTSSISADGSVIASAGADKAAEGALDSATGAVAAVGAGVAGAVGAVTNAGEKALDFNVRPPTTKSDEFRDLSDVDLINNGTSTAAKTSSTSTNVSTPTTTNSTPAAVTTQAQTSRSSEGSVIASTSGSGAGEARLIDERKPTPPQSSRTERVITSKQPTSSKPALVAQEVTTTASTSSASVSPTGYAIQLLATSSASRAQGLVDVMKGEGYDAYSTKVTQNGKLLYRVRIGRYATKAAATDAQAAMKRRYKKNDDVNRSAIVSR